jgi:hypothetical protein
VVGPSNEGSGVSDLSSDAQREIILGPADSRRMTKPTSDTDRTREMLGSEKPELGQDCRSALGGATQPSLRSGLRLGFATLAFAAAATGSFVTDTAHTGLAVVVVALAAMVYTVFATCSTRAG